MTPTRPKNFYLILILGVLTALCPFSIDMYLPAFPHMAASLGIPVARLSLTLSSFFIGIGIGQMFYGPLLDRFGRKRPLYVGLLIYMATSVGCLASRTIEVLVAFRFLQAIGGCVASVAAMAMVRDFFEGKESAKIFSLLTLILGVSPLLAPTVGGYLASAFGWQSIFVVLAVIAAAMLLVSWRYLPEGRPADAAHSLHPMAVIKSYISVFREPQFYTYSLAASFAFAGLFVYLAASPMIFLGVFHVSTNVYTAIFAFIAAGFIGIGQSNFLLLRRFSNEQVLLGALWGFFAVCVLFALLLIGGLPSFGVMVAIFFLILATVGIASPNAAALALAPFAENAGTAAALMGALQMAVGSVASLGVGLIKTESLLPIAGLFVVSAVVALTTVLLGTRQIAKRRAAQS